MPQKLKVSKKEANEIEKNTRGQSGNDQWIKERSVHITLSFAIMVD